MKLLDRLKLSFRKRKVTVYDSLWYRYCQKRVDKVPQEVIIGHKITTGTPKIDQIYSSPTC